MPHCTKRRTVSRASWSCGMASRCAVRAGGPTGGQRGPAASASTRSSTRRRSWPSSCTTPPCGSPRSACDFGSRRPSAGTNCRSCLSRTLMLSSRLNKPPPLSDERRLWGHAIASFSGIGRSNLLLLLDAKGDRFCSVQLHARRSPAGRRVRGRLPQQSRRRGINPACQWTSEVGLEVPVEVSNPSRSVRRRPAGPWELINPTGSFAQAQAPSSLWGSMRRPLALYWRRQCGGCQRATGSQTRRRDGCY